MKKRTVLLFGYDVEIFDFGYAQYMYPAFNGNAEYRVNKEGYKRLSHYLRTCNWLRNLDIKTQTQCQ